MVWKVGPGFKEGNIKHTRGTVGHVVPKADFEHQQRKWITGALEHKSSPCSPRMGAQSTVTLFHGRWKKALAVKESQCFPEWKPHYRMLQQLGHQRSPSFQTSYEATAWETNSIKLRIGKVFATNVISWITRWITYILQHMRGVIENRCKCSQTQVFLWHKSEYIDFFFFFRLCFAVRPKPLKC